jgi:hypothetical protein
MPEDMKRGKDKDKTMGSSATWTSADEAILVQTLKEAKAEGDRGDNNPKKNVRTDCKRALASILLLLPCSSLTCLTCLTNPAIYAVFKFNTLKMVLYISLVSSLSILIGISTLTHPVLHPKALH